MEVIKQLLYLGKSMKVFAVYRYLITTLLLLFIALSSFLPNKDKLRYTQIPTISIDYEQEKTLIVPYSDSLTNDSLFLVKTNVNIPIHYFRNITTEVCFDKKCRLLNIIVYWNITGRYLGFELPDGEFLSKHDHEPFSNSEYEKLNDLLVDPNLPFREISFERLIEIPETTIDSVDAVSGATRTDLSKMVVKGAAYTTYTLWNIVHGATKYFVASITEQQLSPDLISLILRSPDISDRVWALDKINQKTTLNSELTNGLLDLIGGDDFFLAYSAINTIKAAHLNSETFQFALFKIYQEADHSIKRMIIQKLKEAPFLSTELLKASRKLLGKLNGKQLSDMLKLYTKHSINDLDTLKAVAKILKNENRFIAQQAYKFLKESNFSDNEIEKLKSR